MVTICYNEFIFNRIFLSVPRPEVTVNVLKLRTLKIIIFSAVRNFRNYVYEKMPVFEILECGLSQEKNGIYACQNVVETC